MQFSKLNCQPPSTYPRYCSPSLFGLSAAGVAGCSVSFIWIYAANSTPHRNYFVNLTRMSCASIPPRLNVNEPCEVRRRSGIYCEHGKVTPCRRCIYYVFTCLKDHTTNAVIRYHCELSVKKWYLKPNAIVATVLGVYCG